LGEKTLLIYPLPHSAPPNRIRDSERINEKQLILQWAALEQGKIIYSRDSTPIMVLNPGEENHHNGPDFLNADLFINGKRVVGDVEIHVNEASWKYHGHHRDKKYDSVILHVVTQFSPNPVTQIETVKMEPIFNNDYASSCSLTHNNLSQDVYSIIQLLSEKRWQKKVDGFKHPHHQSKAFFIERSFVTLGSKGNEKAFQSLAKIMIAEIGENLSQWEMAELFERESLSLEWNTCGIRPAKHPKILIPKMAQLFYYIFNEYDLFIHRPVNLEKSIDRLQIIGFGKGLITEWLGNVFLPFLGGQALLQNELDLYIQWQQEWLQLFLPYSYSKIHRKYGSFLSKRSLKSFSVLQGILELESDYCCKSYCLICPCKESGTKN